MTFDDNDAEPAFTFTTVCIDCGRPLRIVGESEDDLRDSLAESLWQMIPHAAMADPINEPQDFRCPDCRVEGR